MGNRDLAKGLKWRRMIVIAQQNRYNTIITIILPDLPGARRCAQCGPSSGVALLKDKELSHE